MRDDNSLHDIGTLADTKAGTTVRIAALTGGGEFRRKMTDLGLLPGKVITVRRGGKGYPLVVEVLGSQVMLGIGMARKVRVEPVES